jgi:hypothetical protein
MRRRLIFDRLEPRNLASGDILDDPAILYPDPGLTQQQTVDLLTLLGPADDVQPMLGTDSNNQTTILTANL